MLCFTLLRIVQKRKFFIPFLGDSNHEWQWKNCTLKGSVCIFMGLKRNTHFVRKRDLQEKTFNILDEIENIGQSFVWSWWLFRKWKSARMTSVYFVEKEGETKKDKWALFARGNVFTLQRHNGAFAKESSKRGSFEWWTKNRKTKCLFDKKKQTY